MKNILFTIMFLLTMNFYSQQISFQDNSKNNYEYQDNQTNKILFSIRKYILSSETFSPDNYGLPNYYNFDDLKLTNIKKVLEYKVLEKELLAEKEYGGLIEVNSDYEIEQHDIRIQKIIKALNNASISDIVYICTVEFSNIQKPFSLKYVLDDKLNCQRGLDLFVSDKF